MEPGRLRKELLELLTLRTRAVAEAAVAQHWFSHSASPKRAARVALSRLVQSGELTSWRAPIRIMTRLSSQPLAEWSPGLPEPELSQIASQSRARWGRAEVIRTLYSASTQAVSKARGRAARAVRASEASHDVALSELYLHMTRLGARGVSSWRGEDSLGAYVECLPVPAIPDALTQFDGRFVAIELVGRYRAEKLRAFHTSCERARLAYELW